ncbi:agamous-like MADS-box protein AGL80 [Rhodamnia argentea]|uniref:Agamous-like MADS-box protein AGL80 n=1 Tax=Rhodamnia argentea TaxID=178133 RepID=A0A8B8MQL4_9MYRT|nr:agamous-like MADS-box protein AGL80 [Rhodamnia argentea]
MTRKKVTLAYIANDAARKATFKKRRKGLMKKVSELSTLCGIEACAIVYSPYQAEPEVWPSTLGARRAIARFKNMSEMDQSKRMVNQQGFIRQRIVKAEEQLKRQLRENREKEICQVMYRALVGEPLQGLTLVDLNDLGWMLEKTGKEIEERIKKLKNMVPGSEQAAPAEPKVDKGSEEENGEAAPKNNAALNDVVAVEAMQNQPWYMEFLKPRNESNTMNLSKNEPRPSYPYGNPPPPWSNFFFP